MARITPLVFVADDDISIRESLESLITCAGWAARLRALCHRHGSLSRREREVMALVVLGRLNKHVAADLGILASAKSP